MSTPKKTNKKQEAKNPDLKKLKVLKYCGALFGNFTPIGETTFERSAIADRMIKGGFAEAAK